MHAELQKQNFRKILAVFLKQLIQIFLILNQFYRVSEWVMERGKL